MASSRILVSNLCKYFNKLSLQKYYYPGCKNALRNDHPIITNFQPTLVTCRYTYSFFNRHNADELWKGTTSVSPAGRRKGRGRAVKKIRDLNKGQIMGCGKINMLWPGLNAPIVQGREVLRQQSLPPDETRERRLIEIRNKLAIRKRPKLHPLERGWAGTRLPGRSLGPPDPVGDETFEGFDSKCIWLRTVNHMTATRGRVRSQAALVVVGNKKGLAGFAYAKATNAASAAKTAKNRAAKNLRYFHLDGNTIIHDFYSEYVANKIFVERRPEGYGLVCQRAIKAICEMIGIKDMYAKCEGPTKNCISLTRAFIIGLMKQKSFQQIADEKQLHIVKYVKTRDNFPVLVASPEKCRNKEEIPPTELIDYNLHLHDGRVPEERKRFQPFYINFPSYIKRKKEQEKLRNRRDVQIQLLAKYGALKSHVQVRLEEEARQKLKNTVEETT